MNNDYADALIELLQEHNKLQKERNVRLNDIYLKLDDIEEELKIIRNNR